MSQPSDAYHLLLQAKTRGLRPARIFKLLGVASAVRFFGYEEFAHAIGRVFSPMHKTNFKKVYNDVLTIWNVIQDENEEYAISSTKSLLCMLLAKDEIGEWL